MLIAQIVRASRLHSVRANSASRDLNCGTQRSDGRLRGAHQPTSAGSPRGADLKGPLRIRELWVLGESEFQCRDSMYRSSDFESELRETRPTDEARRVPSRR